jgi:hypothetical protein
VISIAALLAVYVAIAALGDSRAWSGSDAGGKVATVKYMADHHTWWPEVGYWADRADPSGARHPLIYTSRKGSHWIQVTSFPFVYLGVPLWHVAGTDGLLVLPILGSLLAAVAARRLARAVGARRGWGAFWLVGLGSPMAFYAADFWEHSAAVGLALLAVALALEEGTWRRALAAGLVAGLAATLRTEMLVYAVAVAVALVFVGSERRAWLRQPARLAAAAVGFVGVVGANLVTQRVLIGAAVQVSRATVQIGHAGTNTAAAPGGPSGNRVSDALLTGFGLFADDSAKAYLFGALLVLALGVVGWAALRPRRDDIRLRGGAVVGAGLYVARLVDGLGFVPGMVPAAPMAAAGITAPRTGRQRAIAAGALLALPIVWTFQWQGQLLPQWGGRLVLLSGALLTVVGAVGLERVGWRTPGAVLLVAAAVGITAFGVAWHVQRTRGVARAVAAIERAPAGDVIVSGLAHLGREGGAWYGDHRWLDGAGRDGLASAAAVARDEGARAIDVVQLAEQSGGRVARRGPAEPAAPAPTIAGFAPVSGREVPFLGFHLVVWRYTAT